MPKLKRTPGKYDHLAAMLLGKKELLHLTYEQIAAPLGVCEKTARNCFRDLGELRLKDLPKLARLLDIPAEEMRAAIPFH